MSWESQSHHAHSAVPSVAMAIPGPVDHHHSSFDNDKDKKVGRRVNETDMDKEIRKEKRREREKLQREKENEDESEQRRKRRREQDQHRGERMVNTPELESRKQKRRTADSNRRQTMSAEMREHFNQKRRAMHLKRKQNPIENAPQAIPRPIGREQPIPPSLTVLPHHIQQDHNQVVAIPHALSMMHSV
jgi:hypothetical protein